MAFQNLVNNGHRFDDIQEYTWTQFLAFAKAVREVQDSRSIELLSLLCAGNSGDKKVIDKVIESYTKRK